ncbi:MAG: Holliday junction branch migration protein RuvA [Gammaproteobacteria bacterium]|nr:Holliday junction branch migration protein RuvA [Gammaproteobacteria bacterium]
MIGRIRGTLLEKQLAEIQVDVNGIGYEIQVPMSTMIQLPEVGKELVLHTHLAVREDAQTLYGFIDIAQKMLFRALIKVSGVGPKLALAILSGMAVGEFVRTVSTNDVPALVKIPGVGKKTAERLVIEMRDRLSDWGQDSNAEVSAGSAPGSLTKINREAETGLMALGYKPSEASRAVSQILKDNPDIDDSETLIRLALKSMVRT